MMNPVEGSIEFELMRRIENLERENREMRTVQKTLMTLGGAGQGNGLFLLHNDAGDTIVQMDDLGVEVFGQGVTLSDSQQFTHGFLGYGIGGGDAVVLAAQDGSGVTLLTGYLGGLGPIRLLGDRVSIPGRTSNPGDNGDAVQMWYRTDTNELYFRNGGTLRKIATVAG